MIAQTAVAALLEAWSACGYDPALAALHFPRYAFRELCPRKLPDGAVELTVAKRGFGYKQHGRRPSTPPCVDLRGVGELLGNHLPCGITIRSVEDGGKNIIIILEGKKHA